MPICPRCQIFLVPNCPRCQIDIGCQIVLFYIAVPTCPGAKLSKVEICSRCQIVLFYIAVPNCPDAKLSQVPNCTKIFTCTLSMINWDRWSSHLPRNHQMAIVTLFLKPALSYFKNNYSHGEAFYIIDFFKGTTCQSFQIFALLMFSNPSQTSKV